MEKFSKSISFVMPCYNDGDTIEKAVRSIKDQDLRDIEMVVVNDGSTDDSKTVLDALKEQGLIDTLIHLEKNSGACVARNIGAKEAKGKYLSFLPADAILYPGMATIWYDTLEENPDYDFVYGGYRFVDADGEPIPQSEYFSQKFEPYLLEVTNYIDGSYPIKTESFWKYANIMNQPDGLWDPKVKSLQDWDFWLSVVKNGGKGIYIQDIFFGTTMPHPGGLSYDSSNNWIERTNFIKEKHGIPKRDLCVASLGAGWHAKRIAYMLGADFKEMPSFKPHQYNAIYAIGFYPEFAGQQDKMFFNDCYNLEKGRTPAKKIVHFVGTDIWQLYNMSIRSLKVWQEYMKNAVDEVLCEADFTQQELKELGIDAKVVPIPPAKLYDIRPLPKEFTVACYLPNVNREFYRPAEMIEVAKRMPEVKFKFFGNPLQMGKDPALTDNIEYCGYINDMDSFISECSAIMRFPVHDGLPLSVLEFLLAGRYSVQSVPVPHSFFIPTFNVESVVEGIKQIRELTKNGVNTIASESWREVLSHDKYINTIKTLAEYDPKQYWEKRSNSWLNKDQTYLGFAQYIEPKKDEIKAIFEKYKPKSVLEIGCGDARWYPDLKEWGVEEYKGIDISENLIKGGKEKFPELDLEACDVKDFKTEKKYDLVFSFTCLNHVKESDFEDTVKAIKTFGKTLVLAEPTGFKSQYYCHDYDYKKHFNVIEEGTIVQPEFHTNKTLLVCDLQS